MESTIKKVDETIMNLCDFINDGIKNKAAHTEIGAITGNLASLVQARAELSKGTQNDFTDTAREETKEKKARMRTIENAVALIKEEDSDSDVTASLLRTAIKNGKIPVVKAGTKTLIDVDSCLERLYQFEKPQEEVFVDRSIIQPSKEGKRNRGIRPVSL